MIFSRRTAREGELYKELTRLKYEVNGRPRPSNDMSTGRQAKVKPCISLIQSLEISLHMYTFASVKKAF